MKVKKIIFCLIRITLRGAGVRGKSARLSLSLCLLSGLASSSPGQKNSTPLPTNEVIKALTFVDITPINLSPGDAWVAYTLRSRRKSEPPTEERYIRFTRTGVPVKMVGCDVWITNTRTDESKNLTEGKGSSWSPVWSPDGNRLAFFSDRSGQANLWVWEKSSGTLRQVSDAIVRQVWGYDGVRWTPDGMKILVKILPEDLALEDAANLTIFTREQYRDRQRRSGSTALIYSSTAAAELTGSTGLRHGGLQTNAMANFHLADLAMIDISTGDVQRVARGINPAGHWMSPDGSHIAFTNAKGWEGGNVLRDLSDLVVVSLSSAQARVVATNINLGFWKSRVSWSPDGKLLSYTTEDGECFIVPTGGGKPRKASTGPHPSFASALFLPPIWDSTGQTLYFLASDALWKVSVENGTAAELARIPGRNIVGAVSSMGGERFLLMDGRRSMLIITRDDKTKQMGFYKVELTTGKSTKLLEENKDYGWAPIFNIDVSFDGLTAVYVAEDAQHCEDIWVSDIFFQRPRRLTHINPQLDYYRMGESRLIEWIGMDGERLRGALLLPANYEEGKHYPLIVYVYGTAFLSNNVNRFGLHWISPTDNMQLLATRGYAVLLPDAPTRVGTPMQDIFKAVMPGVDKVIELGVADPERLGVMGHSYGGYSTLSLIVQTKRFKAAISFAGMGNLLGLYSAMRKDGSARGIGIFQEGLGRMGESPWGYRERYIENSPMFYLDRVQTPLMIIQGALDNTVPQFLADEIFVDLRHLGKKVQYAVYEGEWHLFEGYANQVDYYDRMLEWFDKYLKQPKQGGTITGGDKSKR
jgi:dipeptidyl aminopeptidase/acylaminoacyl peptidase